MSNRIAAVQFAVLTCGLLAIGCCLSVPLCAQARLSLVQLQDSSPEHAFSLDVPKGWTAKAGMFRLGYSDVRIMVDLKSLDGKVNVRLGEVSIPPYALPNQFHPREGDFDLGAQAQLTVASYRTGQQFAEKYAETRFKEPCRSLTPDTCSFGLDTRQFASRPSGKEVKHWGIQLQMQFRCRSDDRLCVRQDQPWQQGLDCSHFD